MFQASFGNIWSGIFLIFVIYLYTLCMTTTSMGWASVSNNIKGYDVEDLSPNFPHKNEFWNFSISFHELNDINLTSQHWITSISYSILYWSHFLKHIIAIPTIMMSRLIAYIQPICWWDKDGYYIVRLELCTFSLNVY